MIEALRNFFDLNNELVLFVYGQVFFVLGLAIALQSRRHSRLELARTLRWLSVFGITHGFYEWGLLLIPIQATYVSLPLLLFLQSIHVILLGISFWALFQFGAALLHERWPDLFWIPPAITTVWLLWFLIGSLLTSAPSGVWQQQLSVWARYLLGFPGALLSAVGLRYQAKVHIKPLNLTHIYLTLRVAGLALIAYAFLAGLVVPYGDFFPANWLNQSLLVRWIGVPVPVFRSLTGLVMAVTIIRAMEVFNLEIDRLIEQMELEQGLAAERERIGRELHDGAMQRVYTAGLIIESARRKVTDDDVVGKRLDRAMTALNEAIAAMRAYMGDLRTEPSVLSLVEGLRQQVADPRLTTLMDVTLELDLPETAVFNPAQTTHVLAIVGEALANAARHAHAHRVKVQATRQNGQFVMHIKDDGQGFIFPPKGSGYGLRNMRDRARLLGGELHINSEPGRGTQITLIAPWEEN